MKILVKIGLALEAVKPLALLGVLFVGCLGVAGAILGLAEGGVAWQASNGLFFGSVAWAAVMAVALVVATVRAQPTTVDAR